MAQATARRCRAFFDGCEPAVEREFAGIAAVLENHLTYEERVLVSVLDGLHVDPGSPDDSALRAPLQGILEPGSAPAQPAFERPFGDTLERDR